MYISRNVVIDWLPKEEEEVAEKKKKAFKG